MAENKSKGHIDSHMRHFGTGSAILSNLSRIPTSWPTWCIFVPCAKKTRFESHVRQDRRRDTRLHVPTGVQLHHSQCGWIACNRVGPPAFQCMGIVPQMHEHMPSVPRNLFDRVDSSSYLFRTVGSFHASFAREASASLAAELVSCPLGRTVVSSWRASSCCGCFKT